MILLLAAAVVVFLVLQGRKPGNQQSPYSSVPFSPLQANVPASDTPFVPDWSQGVGADGTVSNPNSAAVYYGGQSSGLKAGSW